MSMRSLFGKDKMEDELKKAEHLSHKDPERAMELLSAIGMYLPSISSKVYITRSFETLTRNIKPCRRIYFLICCLSTVVTREDLSKVILKETKELLPLDTLF